MLSETKRAYLKKQNKWCEENSKNKIIDYTQEWISTTNEDKNPRGILNL